MLRKTITALLLATLASGTSAHEVWLEREGEAVKVYVGDATGERDQGEAIAKLVATSRLFLADPASRIPVTAHADHLSAPVTTPGDVRYYNDQVWEPWQTREGVTQAAAFQARAGRSETRAVHDFELVPLAANSDSFTLLFKGQPLADTAVTVINPGLWEKTFTTDDAGRLTVPVTDKGRYILVARHTAPANAQIAGQTVASLEHVTSLSFVAH
jgi:uncharacterized GH25 family protein